MDPKSSDQNTVQNSSQNNSSSTTPSNTQSNTQSTSSTHANNNTLLGVLSYLGILVIISYFMRKESSFVMFHVKQGLALFGVEIVILVLRWIVPSLGLIWSIMNLITFVVAIIGIVNVAQGKEKELPVIGDWARGISL
jgi:uncharacterized membrane protein